jgi:hypothetical protein
MKNLPQIRRHVGWIVRHQPGRPAAGSRYLLSGFLAPHGRAYITINEQWPLIKADLDAGRLSPMALVLVKTHDVTQIGHNHQVLACGYDLSASQDLTIHIYDPNAPNDDNVTVTLNVASSLTPASPGTTGPADAGDALHSSRAGREADSCRRRVADRKTKKKENRSNRRALGGVSLA